MKLSKYVFQIPLESGNTVLYNSFNRAVVELENEYFSNGELIYSRFSDEEVEILEEMDYFISDKDSKDFFNKSFNEDNKLTISVELTLDCNLRCSYCYQKELCYEDKYISNKTMDAIVDYAKNVYDKKGYEILNLILLGGEPSKAKQQFDYLFTNIKKFCHSKNIKFALSIDTNGTDVEYFTKLEGYDELYVTIPLSHKSLHDDIRMDKNGTGTYELILDNINKLQIAKPDASINIRHNTDGENYLLFSSFVQDICSKLKFRPNIHVNYTLELDDKYKNSLSYTDYMKWKSTDVIDVLIKNDVDILFAPHLLMKKCMLKEPYSIKVSMDGGFAPCAMYFGEKNKPNIYDIKENIDLVHSYWPEKMKQITEENTCMKCNKIYLCGGGKLPCTDVTYKGKQCGNHLSHGIDLKLFIKKYMKYVELGLDHYFDFFNDPTPRR